MTPIRVLACCWPRARSFRLQPGQRRFVTLKLNATGRKLLKRFKKLPMRLTVTRTQLTPKPLVVKTAKLTLKSPRKR